MPASKAPGGTDTRHRHHWLCCAHGMLPLPPFHFHAGAMIEEEAISLQEVIGEPWVRPSHWKGRTLAWQGAPGLSANGSAPSATPPIPIRCQE